VPGLPPLRRFGLRLLVLFRQFVRRISPISGICSEEFVNFELLSGSAAEFSNLASSGIDGLSGFDGLLDLTAFWIIGFLDLTAFWI
jgi:hypothetical protein